MTDHEALTLYITHCQETLSHNSTILKKLNKEGITENFIFETFKIGFSDGGIAEKVTKAAEAQSALQKIGILEKERDRFENYLVIPICDENKVAVNIVGYSLHPNKKQKLNWLKDTGIFDSSFLQKSEELVLTENPLHALLLINNEHPNATFLYGSDQKYVTFLKNGTYRRMIFTFEGKARLFYDLTKNGMSTQRIPIDFEKVKPNLSDFYIEVNTAF